MKVKELIKVLQCIDGEVDINIMFDIDKPAIACKNYVKVNVSHGVDGQLVVRGKDIIQLDPSGIGGCKVGRIDSFWGNLLG